MPTHYIVAAYCDDATALQQLLEHTDHTVVYSLGDAEYANARVELVVPHANGHGPKPRKPRKAAEKTTAKKRGRPRKTEGSVPRTSASDQVRALLAHAEAPMAAAEIKAALPKITTSTIDTFLSSHTQKGVLVRTGKKGSYKFRLKKKEKVEATS